MKLQLHFYDITGYLEFLSSIIIFCFVFVFVLLSCWVWVHCAIYKDYCNISNISYLNLPLPPFSFIPHTTHSWSSLNRYLFFHLHSCVYSFLHHIHPFTRFLTSSAFQLVSTTQSRTNLTSCSPILQKKEKRNDNFCFFKITTQGVSLWHFHVYMYYSPIRFISSYFSSFYLVHFLWFFSTSLKILH
jgi:hypothetical protein